MRRALVFGATGMIGRAIVAELGGAGADVLGVSRSAEPLMAGPARLLALDPLGPAPAWDLLGDSPFDAVVWAQGTNRNDSIYAFDAAAHLAVLQANVVYVAVTLAELLRRDQLVRPARLCVVSSIWQTIARQDKLSYTVSKAALQGLVLSAAVDLGRDGHLINAVLPGVLDTPMTRAMLTPGQIAAVEQATLFGRLATPGDVAATVAFLCSEQNRGMTGQFVAVDLGFSHAKRL
jgi:NAD(P)-dependent dehydrogenase (short-subunit alcohol dehydrogenase family)